MSKDYLTEDTILPEGQKFVCISFLTDPSNKLTLSGIKIRGVFSTLESASEHAKKIQSVDPAHNVFVGEMGKWLAFDPDSSSEAAGNAEYANEQLNSIMKGYLENQEKTKIFYEKRKYESLKDNLQEAINTSNKTVQELKEKMKDNTNEDEVKDLSNKLDAINRQISELESKKKNYEKKENKYSEKLANKEEQNVSV